IAAGRVNFVTAGLPQYKDCYAVVLDSLFSKTELSAVLAQAEASSPYEVAQINGGSYQFTDTSYRNSQRIIYDSFELSAKIFERVRPHLKDIEVIKETVYDDESDGLALQEWRMARLNERLRFLRYSVGGFFKPHIDGCYEAPNGQRTFYTLQFYLPSDPSGSDESFLSAEGGTTRFFGGKGTYADVQANPGRILVFQHASLIHTGEEITGGVKCAVRSDILYEKAGNPVPFSRGK
ncbi:hypothetical protein C8R43DRAFT_886222, partial [Mycena crocata]